MLNFKSKTLLVVVNKLLKTKRLLTSPSNVLPYYLKPTFPPIIWIFTQCGEDEIESKLSSQIFDTLITRIKYWENWFREQAKSCAQAKSCEQVSRFGFWETGVWIWFWETGVRKQVSDFLGGKQVSGNRCLNMAKGNRCRETGVLIPVGNWCRETGVWIWL